MKIEDETPGPFRRASLRDLKPERYYRVLGRFHTWKRLISVWRSLQQMINPERGYRPVWTRTESLFGEVPIQDWLRQLRAHGFCAGLQLPKPLVDEIHHHARSMPCLRHAEDSSPFWIDEVRNGRSPNGEPVAIADVISLSCAAIDRITHDPLLIEIARRYLGYRPERVARRLFWSPVSDLPEEARRDNGQTIDYHYDIEPHNSLYVFFYIIGADRHSGAHVTVARSHIAKPLPIVWSSAFQPESRVLERYGSDSPVVIEGGPGFGFLEDPACFHKALAPRHAPRLVLQLRYS